MTAGEAVRARPLKIQNDSTWSTCEATYGWPKYINKPAWETLAICCSAATNAARWPARPIVSEPASGRRL